MAWFSNFFREANKNTPSRNESHELGPVTYQSQIYDQKGLKNFSPLLCVGYELSGSFTLMEIESFIRKQKRLNPNKVLLATLDDMDQAFYTSGHSIMKHDLDDVNDHDISCLPPTLFEGGEHIGYLSTPSEFFIRKGNFISQTLGVKLADIVGKRLWTDFDGYSPSILTHIKLDCLKREKTSYVQIVPVKNCYEAICAFPNGYFSDDYSPFENYILSRHLYEEFGYELFGVGATYMGFMRDSPLPVTMSNDLAKFLSSLYSNYEGKIPLEAKILSLLEDSNAFYLAYADH